MTKFLKTATASAIVSASLALAPAAQAAHSIQYDFGLNGDFAAEFGNEEPTAPTFSDAYTPFTVMTAGSLLGTISESSPGLTFTLALVNDTGDMSTVLDFFPLVFDGNPSFGSGSANINPGTYQLVVEGNAAAGRTNSYSGTLNFAPVPEPATWAMLLLGFGVIGFGMRRRKAVNAQPRIRVNFA